MDNKDEELSDSRRFSVTKEGIGRGDKALSYFIIGGN